MSIVSYSASIEQIERDKNGGMGGQRSSRVLFIDSEQNVKFIHIIIHFLRGGVL